MGSMCSQEKPAPCLFDGEKITCNNNMTYSLDQQEEIPFVKKMYDINYLLYIKYTLLICIFLNIINIILIILCFL